jgi:uncharacterized membrane protein YsdA (DUF1294 family)
MNKYLSTTENVLIAAASTATLAAAIRYMGLRWLFSYVAAVNIVTFGAYFYDKQQALKNRSRIPELLLHLLALASASPAALIAQIMLPHKTRKLTFKITFFAIILAQITLITAFLLRIP